MISAAAGVLLIVLAVVDFLPAVNQLLKSGDEQAIRQYFEALGINGVLFLILLQAVQVMTSLIPALSLQAAAGASYGPVSYTHLDVYKRQVQYYGDFNFIFTVHNLGGIINFLIILIYFSSD